MTYLFLKPNQFDNLRDQIGTVCTDYKLLGSVYPSIMLGSFFRGVVEHMTLVLRLPE